MSFGKKITVEHQEDSLICDRPGCGKTKPQSAYNTGWTSIYTEPKPGTWCTVGIHFCRECWVELTRGIGLGGLVERLEAQHP